MSAMKFLKSWFFGLSSLALVLAAKAEVKTEKVEYKQGGTVLVD